MTLQLSSLTVELEGTTIVDGIDLDVGGRERLAVMGPSGAGKSTLLRSIAGLVPLTSGRIEIDGIDHTATPPHRRGVGLMFQDYALFPHMDVQRNVAYGLRMAGMPQDQRDERVHDLLSMVGLTDQAGRRIDGLSGGEQQRVALARTLAPAPRVVLFDEPLGSLDQALRDDLLAQMRSIVAHLGIAAIYVTHDRHEAEAFADRIAIMRRGRIERTSEPQQLWQDPGTEFVARMMGHRTIVDGAIVGRRSRVALMDRAIVPTPSGNLEGMVAASTFRDGRHRITVDVAGQRLELWSAHALTVGTPIRLAVDPAGIIELSD